MNNNYFNTNQALTQMIDGFVNSTIGDFIGSDQIASHPRVNIYESENEYKIELAAPGLKKSDFKITLKEDRLFISAEVENAKEDEHTFKRREFNYNSFSRSFNLPKLVAREAIDASYKNGILKVVLPKKEEDQSINKKIEIL